MRFLYAFRDFLQTWQGTALTIIAILGTLYYGPRKMLETLDWYFERYWDNEVFFLVEHRKVNVFPPARSNFPAVGKADTVIEFPYTAPEIAEQLGRKESSVQSSLKRLRRRGKIEPYQDGWRLKVKQ